MASMRKDMSELVFEAKSHAETVATLNESLSAEKTIVKVFYCRPDVYNNENVVLCNNVACEMSLILSRRLHGSTIACIKFTQPTCMLMTYTCISSITSVLVIALYITSLYSSAKTKRKTLNVLVLFVCWRTCCCAPYY
jgi:hypothetical protein